MGEEKRKESALYAAYEELHRFAKYVDSLIRQIQKLPLRAIDVQICDDEVQRKGGLDQWKGTTVRGINDLFRDSKSP